MLVSLCASFTTSAAAADTNTVTVTMKRGDKVADLCTQLGVNYYTHKNLIMSMNGFTSEKQFSGLAVGTQVTLPASETAAAALESGAATTLSASSAAPAAMMTPSASAPSYLSSSASAIPAGDYTSYYLVNYKTQSGDTMDGIYSRWGLSYRTFENQIKKLNGLSNVNNISANKTYLLPTTSPAVANSAYYTVMAHVIKSGETAYDIISRSYGLSLNQQMLSMTQAINNVASLDYITAGNTLYIPITGIVTASSTYSTSTSSLSTMASVSTSANYSLAAETAVNGSFDLMVDGKSATIAQAGKTVSIVATPDYGYTVDTIRVFKVGDSASVVAVNNNSFVMPSYSVIVSVTFKQAVAYNITVDSSENGTVVAMVNGSPVTKGYVGNTVSVRAIPKTGYMLENVRVTYNNYKDSVAVQNNMFVMPSTGVNVTAKFVLDPNYVSGMGNPITVDANFCTVSALVGGVEAKYAKKDDVVKLDITPYTNYTVESIKVYNSDYTKILATDKLTFIMPDAPVNVIISVKPTPNAEFAISVVDPVNGKVDVLVDEKAAKSAKVGQTVLVIPTETKPAYNSIVTVFKTSDSSVAVPVTEHEDGTVSFTMPDYAVTVRVKFYTYYNVKTHASNGQYGTYGVVWANNQSFVVDKAAAGLELKVGFSYIAPGYSVSEILLVYADGSSYSLDGTNFIMPDCDVTVRVKFAPTAYIRAYAITENDSDKSGVYPCWGNTYTVGGVTLNDLKANYINVPVAEKSLVTVTPYAGIGSRFQKIVYSYKDTTGAIRKVTVDKKDPITLKYQFMMPADIASDSVLELRVYFEEVKTYAVSQNYTDFDRDTNNADHSRGTYSFLTAYDYTDHAAEDTKIYIVSNAAAGFKADLTGVKIYKADGTDVTSSPDVNYDKIYHSFFMPAYDISIYVPFTESMFYVKLEKSFDYAKGLARGELSAIIGNTHFTEETMTMNGADMNHLRTVFESGTQVQLVNRSEEGYMLKSGNPFSIYKADEYKVDENGNVIGGKDLSKSLMVSGSTDTFILPNFNVVVRANYEDETVNIITEVSGHGTFKAPAQVAWNAPFEISEVAPDEGYELSRILVSYTDFNGVPHKEDEIIAPSKTIKLEGGGKPQSDVTVKVVFAEKLNPVNILYTFGTNKTKPNDDEFDYYNVNLAKYVENGDGSVKIEGDDRNVNTKAWSTNERQDRVKAKNGIPTGAYVMVSRSEVHYDKNFYIAAVTVTNDGIPVNVEPAGSGFCFYMPYAQNPESVVITVHYACYDDGDFYLSNKTIGSKNILDVTYKCGDKDVTMAKAGDEITFTIKHKKSITVDAVNVCCTDADNVEYSVPVNVSSNADNTETTGTFKIGSVPVPATVSLEYTGTNAKRVLTLTKTGLKDFIITKLDDEGNEVPVKADDMDKIPWDTVIRLKLCKAGHIANKLSGVGDEPIAPCAHEIIGGTEYEVFEFVMPEADITVTPEFTEAKTVTYVDTSEKSSAMLTREDGSETALANGNTVKAVKDSTVTFTVNVPLGYKVTGVKAKVGTGADSPIADDNGVYSVKVTDDVIITVTTEVLELQKKPVKIKYSSDSVFSMLEVGGESVFKYIHNGVTADLADGTEITAGDTVYMDANLFQGYVVGDMLVTYKDINGADVINEIDYLANGKFTLGSVPDSDISILVRMDRNTDYRYYLKATPKGLTDPAGITLYVNGAPLTEGFTASANSRVDFVIAARYDVTVNPDTVKVSFNEPGGGLKEYLLKDMPGAAFDAGQFDSKGMTRSYTGYFYMPAADAELSFNVSRVQKFAIDTTGYCKVYSDEACTTKTDVGTIEESFYVVPDKVDGWTIDRVTATYYVHNALKPEEGDMRLVVGKQTGNNVFELRIDEPSMWNFVTVSVDYIGADGQPAANKCTVSFVFNPADAQIQVLDSMGKLCTGNKLIVTQGANASFTLYHPGYNVNDVKLNSTNATLGANNGVYVLPNVTEHCTITVTATKQTKPVVLTYTDDSAEKSGCTFAVNGSIGTSGVTKATEGDKIKVSVTNKSLMLDRSKSYVYYTDNTGTERFIPFSTTNEAEIVGIPNSDKITVAVCLVKEIRTVTVDSPVEVLFTKGVTDNSAEPETEVEFQFAIPSNKFVKVKIGGKDPTKINHVPIDASNTLYTVSFSMPHEDVVITLEVTDIPTYSVTFKEGTSGQSSFNKAIPTGGVWNEAGSKVPAGDTATFKIIFKYNYEPTVTVSGPYNSLNPDKTEAMSSGGEQLTVYTYSYKLPANTTADVQVTVTAKEKTTYTVERVSGISKITSTSDNINNYWTQDAGNNLNVNTTYYVLASSSSANTCTVSYTGYDGMTHNDNGERKTGGGGFYGGGSSYTYFSFKLTSLPVGSVKISVS